MKNSPNAYFPCRHRRFCLLLFLENRAQNAIREQR